MANRKRMDDDVGETIEWRPEWSGAELEHYQRLRGSFTPSISLFRKFRERMGLSQVDVARILSTTQSNVSKIEAKGDPNVSTLNRIAKAKGGKLRILVDLKDGEVLELVP